MSHRILVTGGGGYLGSVLVPALLAAGHQVTVLDNFMYRQNALAPCCADPRFAAVRGDVRDEVLVGELIRHADVVIPLAALVGAPLCARDPVGATATNLTAQLMLLRKLSPDQRVLIPITNSGYGIGRADKECDEASTLQPVSLYGRHKVEVEQAALDRENTISFRLATVFGMAPRMRLDLLVNDFTYRAVRDRSIVLFEPHFRRNFIHVRDVARVFRHGLENFETMRGQPFNVGLSTANLTKLQLAEKIRDHVPAFAIMIAPVGEDPDKRDYLVSNARIEATGFRPTHSLDDGIRELIKGYAMLSNEIYGNL